MLHFSYYPSSYYESMKEGSWYDIPPGAFAGAQYQAVNADSAGASLLRANLVGVPNQSNFAQFLARPKLANVPASNLALVVQPIPEGPVTLTVVDCGHGNWNEIETTADRVIYDVGASRWFTKAQVRKVVSGRSIASETRPISIIISHWDVDHFHALLEFEPAELVKLRVAFMPSQIPDTETYRRVLKYLTRHGVELAAIQPATRTTTSRVISLEPHWNQGIFTLFRATSGRPRNQTGIVLGVRGQNAVALLTGDHHYDKVLAAVHKVPSYDGQSCVLVTPHHGGPAGNVSATAWLSYFSSLATPISCGYNSYGHPLYAVQMELKAMQAGAIPRRTDLHGTWTRRL